MKWKKGEEGKTAILSCDEHAAIERAVIEQFQSDAYRNQGANNALHAEFSLQRNRGDAEIEVCVGQLQDADYRFDRACESFPRGNGSLDITRSRAAYQSALENYSDHVLTELTGRKEVRASSL